MIRAIDGHDIRNLKLGELRQAIGFVHQESILFNDSILENLRFAKPGASKSEVIAACKKAQAHEFITRLSKGYNTIVGERGVRLSGGERQRLAIARVFLADQPILVLDESTSALDSETELKLQVALKKAMQGRTTIIIAHRLSTVQEADNIIVLDNATFHKREDALLAVQQQGHTLEFLPPHSPDLNPIEKKWP